MLVFKLSHTSDWYSSTGKDLPLETQNVRVISDYDRYNGYAGLHRKMECPFLEGQHIGLSGIAPRTLREDVNGLPLFSHCAGCAIEACPSRSAVATVDENSFAEGHWLMVSYWGRVSKKAMKREVELSSVGTSLTEPA